MESQTVQVLTACPSCQGSARSSCVTGLSEAFHDSASLMHAGLLLQDGLDDLIRDEGEELEGNERDLAAMYKRQASPSQWMSAKGFARAQLWLHAIQTPGKPRSLRGSAALRLV